MAKRKIRTPVEPGDEVVMRDWGGQWLTIKVHRLGESKVHGLTVEGVDVDDYRFVALPLSHKVETARVYNEGRGKWVIELPNGKIEKARSKGAAITLCEESGVVFQEV